MKPEDNIFEHIEDYLNHRLSPEAHRAFEKTLQERPDLSQKVKAHELANDMILENRLLSVNKTLTDYHKSKGGWSVPSKIGLAVGLLAVGTGAFFYFSNTPAPLPVALKQENKTLPDATTSQQQTSPVAPIISKEIAPVQKDIVTKNENVERPTVEIPKTVAEHPTVTPPQEVPDVTEKGHPIEKPQIGPTVAESPIDPCSKVKIVATISPKAACKDENDGSLWLSESKGGTAPYKLQVLDMNKQVVDAHQLAMGSYEVLVKDAQGCVSVQKVVISQRICDKNYLFNAFAGEQLEIPAHTAGGTLKVLDKQGNIYASMTVNANEKATWDGQSKNGELNEGFFNFVLEYTDHVTARGTITIVR